MDFLKGLDYSRYADYLVKGILVLVIAVVANMVGIDIPVDIPPMPTAEAPVIEVNVPETKVEVVLPSSDDIVAYSTYNTDNYSEQGGSSWIVGGDLQVISGGELSATTGSTVDFTGATVDLDGSTLTTGNMVVNGERTAATGNESFVEITGAATGQVANAKTRALEISLEREAGQEIDIGDMADYGLFVRVETEAITTTAGTVLRAVDAEAKADNPNGTVTNLFGGLFTAKSDSGAGSVAQMIALQSNIQTGTQANAVTDALISADFRIARFSTTEPTIEYGVRVRNTSEAGAGADAAIYIETDFAGSATIDSWDYGIDMSAATINTADIRFENGTTLSENTDTILTFSEFIGGAEQTAEVVSGGSTIVPTGTWQPISSTGVVTCSTSTCITAGTQDGQLLILQNVNASDTITIDGTGGNVECKSDVVLGTFDTLTLVWNGADWYCISYYDNS